MKGIDPKWIMWLGLVVTIEHGISGGTLSLTNMIPDAWIVTVKAWSSGLEFIGTAIMTWWAAVSSPQSGPLINTPLAPVAKVIIILAVVLGSLFALPGDASAQGLPKLKPLTGNIVNDIAAARADPAAVTPSGSKIGDSGCKATGDPIADLHCVIKAGGAKLILHLKQSYALASAPGAASGSTTDNTSAMCTKALVPIVDLVVNGPKSGTIPVGDPMALTADEQALASNASELDGPIVVIEKIRILRLAIQSPALNDACGALVQDEVKNAQSLVGKVTSLITGAGILAPIGL